MSAKGKTKYYAGGHRVVIGGVPVRVAAHVKGWSPWMKRALGKGSITHEERKEVARQRKILFPEGAP